MDDYRIIVKKSTVPVGSGPQVTAIIQNVLDERGVNIDFDVVSNPLLKTYTNLFMTV